MIENAQIPEAIAYNLSQLILKNEEAITKERRTKEKILETYRECLYLVKNGRLPPAINNKSIKRKLTIVSPKQSG